MRPTVDSTLVRLRDGRHLCVAEFGDPQGLPVFFFHGGPGSRRAGQPLDKKAREYGLRLITPDRPGSGFSEPKPGRTVLDFTQDVEDVAAAFGIDRFAVFGGSGGGPYAMACAYAMPERLTIAVVGSSPGCAKDDPVLLKAFKGPWRLMAWATLRGPRWAIPGVKLMSKEGKRKEGAEPSAKEQQLLAEAPAWLLEDDDPNASKENKAEMLRQGAYQAAEDLHVIFGRWGFRPKDVRGQVHLWHGESDDAVPFAIGQRMAEQLPNVVTHFVPGGHYICIFLAEEIFADIKASFADEPAAPVKQLLGTKG